MKRFLSLGLFLGLAVCLTSQGRGAPVAPTVPATPAAPTARAGRGVVADIDAEIHAVTADFVKRVIAEAGERGDAVVILRISTPGGRLDSTRDITRTILSSRVPVVGFVTPSGTHAASAGFIVLMACDVAAMAPGTNAGAASPVGGQGEDLPRTMRKKVTEDASALVRSLVVPRGRPVDEAVETVTEAVSYTDSEALQKKLVEVVARDLPDLLKQLDGRTVKRVGQVDGVLKTAGLLLDEKRMTSREKALGVIANPALAGILFLIGLAGIYAELQNPGAILPGVLGGICLLLAFFAMSVLPTNWAGMGLLMLGGLFFFLEVKLAGHGLFALGGAVAIILGALLLFRYDDLAPRSELWFVVGFAVATAGVLALLSYKAISVQSLPDRTGPVGSLVGKVVPVRVSEEGATRVFADGTLWEARSSAPVTDGDQAEIVGVEGLTVLVKPQKRS